MKRYHFGSLHIDRVSRVKLVAARDFNEFPGGKGFNQSLALARRSGSFDTETQRTENKRERLTCPE